MQSLNTIMAQSKYLQETMGLIIDKLTLKIDQTKVKVKVTT